MQSPTFTKLMGQSNYGTWSFAMEMLLVECDLWDCIEGTVTEVTDLTKKRDAKARSKICLMCAESVYPLIVNAKTAKETWIALKNAYADSGLTRRLSLLRKLFSIKLNDFPNIEAYCSDIQATQQALQAIKADLEDEFIGIIMLAGLPETYNPLVMALEHSGCKISSSSVMAALMKEGQRKEHDSVLISKSNKEQSKSKKDISCHFCNKKGHFKWQCKLYKSLKKGNGTAAAANERNMSCADTKALLTSESNKMWILDSGASSHMTSRRNLLKDVRPARHSISTANNEKVISNLQGNLRTEVVTSEGQHVNINFRDVLFVPEIVMNLLSVSKITAHGHKVVFDKNRCMVFKENDVFCNVGNALLTASAKNGLYVLDQNIERALVVRDDHSKMSAHEIWHRRLGHLSRIQMRKLKLLVDGFSFGEENNEPCEACCKGKQCVQKFPKGKAHRAKSLLEVVHTDLAGPMEEVSWGGARYCLIFVDDYSRKVFGYLLKNKNEVFCKFKEFKVLVENETNKKIKCLRSDNGTEFINREFQSFLREKGIRHKTSIAHTPQQNGVAERTIRTVVEKARCMLQDAKLNKRFWGEAINTAIYLKNRSPSMAISTVPEQIWTGEKQDLSHLKIFGSKAYVLVKDNKRKKFDSKSTEMIMVGYSENQKGYRFVDNINDVKRVIVARDVVFMEGSSISHGTEVYNVPNPQVVDISDIITRGSEPVRNITEITDEFTSEQESDQRDTVETEEADEFHDSIDMSQDNQFIDEPVTCSDNNELHIRPEHHESPNERRYPLRDRRRKEDKDMVYNFHVTEDPDPNSLKDAMERTDKELWYAAMVDEFNSLIENETWEIVNRPLDKNVVKCKWVFKLKVGGDGTVLRHKARLVAKGFSQKFGEDYFETFAPVVKLSSIRLLLGLAVEMNLDIHHIDVTTAFLNGDLSEDLYMEQPQMFVKKGDEGKVCKLKKAIYGLKQAARSWNVKVHAHILKIGFTRSKYDPCVYIKKTKDIFIVIGLYVDDFYIFTNNNFEALHLKEQISKVFKIKDLGEARECLGMRITRNRQEGKIYLDQQHYTNKLLQKFGMEECKPVGTPMESNFKLKKGGNTEDTKYQEIIGSLMYLSTCTRPDILYAVSYLSQFNCYNDSSHMAALKRVLRYLKGTTDYAICYEKTNKPPSAYADANWGTNSDGHSFSGYCLIFGGAVISWHTRKQQCVALSTAEAEYIALCEAAKEIVFIKGLLDELCSNCKSVTVYSDSQSAIKMIYNPVTHKRSKHINIRYNYIKELAESKELVLDYCETNSMPADALTKPVSKVKHYYCFDHMGLRKLRN